MADKKTPQVQKILYAVSGLIVVGLIVAYFAIPGFQSKVDDGYQVITSGNNDRITDYVKQFGFWGPLIVILIMIVQMFLVVVPSWLLMIIAILAYGPVWGSVLSVVAVAAASTIGYLVGVGISEAAVSKLVGEKTVNKLEDTVNEHGMGAVVLFRLAPFLSNDAISFIAGALKMGYFRFMAATLAGIIPLTIMIAIFSDNIDQLKSILIWVAGGGLVIYLAYLAYQRFATDD